ncbi:hypothetical protein [Clostridium scatologenes]|uniref:NUMOD1 domain protein n=1 Tax=Clostridium scatologenes TaxID=1548 RepID=A0A0E3K1P9_CLOSL|nr:hypothetical protein [Clostridium scatologenes]AKA70177.1 NUMOD1 domain protein [Clostridium scatologenes]
MKKVFLGGLPRWNKGGKGKEGSINWKGSIGSKVKGVYDDIKFDVKIVNYHKGYLKIKYLNNKPFRINAIHFKNCHLGKLLEKITDEFKIEIGKRFKDNYRDITIVNREHREYKREKSIENRKWYQYKCNNCGFCDNRSWIEENHLMNRNTRCLVCGDKAHIVIEDINSIVANKETHWMIPYFQGGYDEAKLYSKCTEKKIVPVCPECGRVSTKEVGICNIYLNHSIGCNCSDGKSFPEKFLFIMLEKLVDKNFETQKIFDWSKNIKHDNPKLKGNKLYDFYFELNSEGYILETHGLQHYEDCFSYYGKKSKTLEEEQENDKIKENLALKNGIKKENYIILDCRKSELEWIRNSIINSKLNELFDLSSIDWKQCCEFALKSLVKMVCEIKRDNPNLTSTEISNMFKLSKTTVKKYLSKGSKIWNWVHYDPKEEMKKSGVKCAKLKCKEVEIFKDEISLGKFESCTKLEEKSEKVFGIKLAQSRISDICNPKSKRYQTLYKGFTFKYH